MTHTETEAAKKWCHMSKHMPVPGQMTTCITRACMAWEQVTSSEPRCKHCGNTEETTKGTCRPSRGTASGCEFVNVEGTGYCGMVAQPVEEQYAVSTTIGDVGDW